MKDQVIAIDGVCYVGKSTVAQALASMTGHIYVNTGHMYRAVAKLGLDQKISLSDTKKLLALAETAKFEFKAFKTIINGSDWTETLNRYEIVNAASQVALIPEIREILTQKQREFSKNQTIIMEGRDIGSIVFPNAAWKFFITASPEIRAKRMHKLMSEDEKRKCTNPLDLIPKILEIDDRDKNRKIAPLLMADDAILYDNSDSPSEIQDAHILQYYLTHASEIIHNSEKVLGNSWKALKN